MITHNYTVRPPYFRVIINSLTLEQSTLRLTFHLVHRNILFLVSLTVCIKLFVSANAEDTRILISHNNISTLQNILFVATLVLVNI